MPLPVHIYSTTFTRASDSSNLMPLCSRTYSIYKEWNESDCLCPASYQLNDGSFRRSVRNWCRTGDHIQANIIILPPSVHHEDVFLEKNRPDGLEGAQRIILISIS